jgi:inosose dehydratase
LGWDVPPGPGGRPYQRTPTDVKNAIAAIDEISKTCQEEYGMLIALHLECDISKEIMLEILDGTNPRYAHFCPDVGHLAAAGLDAVSTVKKYASRVAVSHWKDFDPQAAAPEYLGPGARGNFVELGKGIVDFPRLAELFKEIGFSGWVMIELDGTRLPLLESARMMKAYVTDRLGLRVYGRHA